MARAIGYSGILAVDYNKCDEFIRLLDKTKSCAEVDLAHLQEAYRYAEGCDGIGDAIPNAIRSVEDKIDRLERFKTNFSNYIEDIKEFDYHFAFDVSNNGILETIRNNMGAVNVNVQGIAELEKLVEKEKFYNMMDKCYGFTPEESRLILKAYDLSMNPEEGRMTKEQVIANAYAQGYNPTLKIKLTDEQKLKDFLRNLSTLGTYSGFLWECVDSAPTEDEANNYFKSIGMSDEEVDNLKKAMVTQHQPDKPGKIDFAHEIVEIASYLNANAYDERIIADVGNFGHTNEMASIKGDIWSGSMSDSDLYANIDSVNVYNRAKNNNYSDFMDTFTNYKISVINGQVNRADEYCANYGDGEIEKGRQKIKNIVDSWSPGGGYLTHKVQDTIKYGISQLQDGLALNAYMSSDPGLKYTKDEVDKIVDDMDRSTTQYNGDIENKNVEIKEARNMFFDFIGIKHDD